MKLAKIIKKQQKTSGANQKAIDTDKFFDIKKITNVLLKIEKKAIKIDKLLKRTLAANIKNSESLRIKREQQSFSERERQLEKKKPKEAKNKQIKLPKAFGIFDWIKNFIFNTILGFIAIRLINFLPNLISILPIISSAADFIIDLGGKLLDGLATLIDWGYKAYDSTREFVKNTFGEDGAKKFDELASTLNKFLDLAIIAGMLAGGPKGGGPKGGGPKGGPKGGGPKGGGPKGGGPRGGPRGITESGGGRAGRPDFRNPLREGPRITESGGGRAGRPDFRNPLRGRPNITGTLAEGAESVAARNAGKSAAKLGTLGTKGIPIVGPLIDFGIRTLVFGESPGKAAAGAVGVAAGQALGAVVGTWLGGAIGGIVGSVVPFVGTLLVGGAGAAIGGIIGEIAGGFLGDWLGTTLYDFATKANTPTEKLAGGGTPSETRRSNVSGPSSRTITTKKIQRTITPIPRPIKPGASVGGKDKYQEMFPDSEKFKSTRQQDTQNQTNKKTKKQNPYQYLVKSAEFLGKSNYFGPLFSIALKSNLGDKPNDVDYNLAAKGLISWLNQTMKLGDNGEGIDVENFGLGEDYTGAIADMIKKSAGPQIDRAQKELAMNLSLQKLKFDEEDQGEGEGGGGEIAGDFSPEGLQGDIYQYLLSKGMDDTHALGIMANIHRESGFRPGVSEAGGPGVGLFQYSSGGRKDAFLRAVPDYPTNWKGQIDYALREDVGPQYSGMRFSSAQEAADWWMREWERPAEYIQDVDGPRIHREYLASLERYRTGRGHRIPTSAELASQEGGTVGGSGTFIQGNSGRSQGIHFHIGPGSQEKGTIGQPGYFADARAAAKKVVKYFLGKKTMFDGRSGRNYTTGSDAEIKAAQDAHTRSGSPGGIDIQVGGAYYPGAKIPFPLNVRSMKYRPGGFGVSADIVGTNAFVAHGYKDEKGRIAPQEGGVGNMYEKGGETLDGAHHAIIGEKGTEYVIDADSYKSTEKLLPGLLDILNYDVNGVVSLKKNIPTMISMLQKYAPYEDAAEQVVVISAPSTQNQQSIRPQMIHNTFGGIIDNRMDQFQILHMV